ncbi:hypothetical protein DPMN_111287 [Dreissena polymorpha]|uniref:Uncharacterized protein n=1 Tax=Dreissena polymorpha TaxID=45954 RepID=A0A9D4JNE5_DREPO|nr:hypothetical protein DPMN_143639 [Dreissena polymorpha]KAH3837885.1 hypothetical protein DPMN_111287 [Dreissena polymorpha]
MKNVIIRNVYVVGMHHGGKRELEVGALYVCKSEPENPWDPNAVAVFDDRDLSRRVCYFFTLLLPIVVLAKNNYDVMFKKVTQNSDHESYTFPT